MTYSSPLLRNSSLALPSRIADRELPRTAETEKDREALDSKVFIFLVDVPLEVYTDICCALKIGWDFISTSMDSYDKQMISCGMRFTIELGLGQDAPTDRKTILPIANIKGRDGRMVGHLAEERQRDI